MKIYFNTIKRLFLLLGFFMSLFMSASTQNDLTTGNINNLSAKNVSLIQRPVYNIVVYNDTDGPVNWSYYSGFAVEIGPSKAKPPFSSTNPATVVIQPESSVTLPIIDSTGFYCHDERCSTYVPGSVGVNIDPAGIRSPSYSFYLTRLGGLLVDVIHPAKYAYITQVTSNNLYTVILNYYDPTHIGKDVNDYLFNDLKVVESEPNGGYIQNLGGSSPDFVFYICDYGIDCAPSQ